MSIKKSTDSLLGELNAVKQKIKEIIQRPCMNEIGLALDFDEYKYYYEKQIEIATELIKRGHKLEDLNIIRIGRTD